MDYERAKSLLRQAGQSHLLDYYGELDEKQRNILLKDIEKTDFTVLENIGLKRSASVGELSPVQAETSENISANREKYEKAGLEVLKAGKVGAVLLAGGQGTRLGFDKPKGMYDIGVTRHLYIFQLLMESVKNAACLSGVNFPLFIMTGEKNDAQTRTFFKENGFFGYPEDRVYFFVQDTEPACSYDGKIFLDEKYSLYYYVSAMVLYSFILCILNQIAVHRHLDYRQELVRTFIKPIVSALIMGAAAFGVYQGLYYLCKINIIALAVAIMTGGIIYFVLIIHWQAVTEEELRSMPKGYLLLRIARKTGIMKPEETKGRKGAGKKGSGKPSKKGKTVKNRRKSSSKNPEKSKPSDERGREGQKKSPVRQQEDEENDFWLDE